MVDNLLNFNFWLTKLVAFCSVESLSVDEDGLRHLLLCRMILGKPEVVLPGNSEQYHPSSHEYDSGVDKLFAPKKYIVWSTHMNTHILPEYVVSFRAPTCLKGMQIDLLHL